MTDPRGWTPMNDSDCRQEAVVLMGEELADRFARVRLMVFDADGILTDGRLMYGPEGEALKQFNARDGLGLVMARVAGVGRAVLTGRNSAIVERRCTELRFDAIKLGRFDKLTALAEILAETGCLPEEALYMGDDLIDLPAMAAVGLAVTVPEAPLEVRDRADWVTNHRGGHGAVREVVELILKSAGLFTVALERLGDRAWQPTRAELSSDADEGTQS